MVLRAVPYDLEKVAQCIRDRDKLGARFSIVVVAEGAHPKDGGFTLIEAAHGGHVERLGGIGIRCAAQLEQRITPALDREFGRLSPVERAILCVGAYELAERADTPFKVVINEAIELGKAFGGTGGHKYVNGVLEKLAAELRPQELAVARTTA